jgi:diaminopimelate decarboxylase
MSSPFHSRDGVLRVDDVPLSEIAAEFGTPTYVYSRDHIQARWRELDEAFAHRPHLVCFAVKANSNLAVLQALAQLGAGFDIVSGGELERVLAAGGDPARVVFSGVGKTTAEIRRALQVGIRGFNAESERELERIDAIAGELGCSASVSLRVNPDVDAGTHPYIATGLRANKFGIDIETALAAYEWANAMPHLQVTGIDCHIGSQLTGMSPFLDALDRVLELMARLEAIGIVLRHIDMGGGLGVRYRDERPPEPAEYAAALSERLGHTHLELLIEPGRAIVANAGALVTRVEYLKHTHHRNFAIVDAAMNDLARPALYDAWHEIVPVVPRPGLEARCYDVVGPVCETGDFLGKERWLAIEESDLLAILSAGAYGFAMSSNYNTRPRPAEVMVAEGRAHLVRPREGVANLFAGERLLDPSP